MKYYFLNPKKCAGIKKLTDWINKLSNDNIIAIVLPASLWQYPDKEINISYITYSNRITSILFNNEYNNNDGLFLNTLRYCYLKYKSNDYTIRRNKLIIY
jgi:hypothetical protein